MQTSLTKFLDDVDKIEAYAVDLGRQFRRIEAAQLLKTERRKPLAVYLWYALNTRLSLRELITWRVRSNGDGKHYTTWW
jgi:hypothetical protein